MASIDSVVRTLCAALLALFLLTVSPASAEADWSCDGEPLHLEQWSGAVDPSGLPEGIPNTLDSTLPGDGVLISWRGLQLQLPRTNNAGAPSYTDGRWWWRAADPAHPEWKQRRGGIINYDCTATTSSS